MEFGNSSKRAGIFSTFLLLTLCGCSFLALNSSKNSGAAVGITGTVVIEQADGVAPPPPPPTPPKTSATGTLV